MYCEHFCDFSHNKYHSGHKIKNIVMGGACSKYGKQEWYIKSFGGEKEGIRLPGIRRCRCWYYIEINLKAIGWESVHWIDLARTAG